MRQPAIVRLTALAGALLGVGCSGSESGGIASPPPSTEQLVVRIEPRNDSILLGTTRNYTATVTTTAGAPRALPVDFTSLDPAIATISGSTVTAIATGQARIVARAGAGADTATLRVFPPQFELRLVPNAVAATLGDTIQFEATMISPAGAGMALRGMTWEVSDSSAATVVRDGAITTIGEGEVLVVASMGETFATASVKVTASAVGSVTIVPSTLSLAIGESGQLTAELRDNRGRLLTGREVEWSSSNTNVATVGSNGIVQAKAVGGVIISARNGKKVASAAVNVTASAASAVTITLPNDSLATGRSMQATATPLDANGNPIVGRPVAWQSSNPAVATINSSGVIVGMTAGQTTISVICDGKIASEKLTSVVPAPHAMAVTPSNANLFTGSSTRLHATVVDQFGVALAGPSVTWQSSATSTATVSSDGRLNAVGTGSATIRALSGSLSASAAVTVQDVPVASVSLAPLSPSIDVGSSVTLSATARDSAGNLLSNRPATWNSASPAVASVSASGVVQGISEGSSVIRAVVEGKSVETTVTVTQPPPPQVARVSVTLSSPTLNVGQTTSAVAVAYDANGNYMSGTSFTFSSTDASIATVTVGGQVKGIGAGSAIIKATAGGVEGLATVTVQQTVLPVHTVLLSASTTSLIVGDSAKLIIELRDSLGTVLTGRTISFTTSAPAVATVSNNGTVRAVGAGTAILSASSEGKSGALTFAVGTSASPPPPPPAPAPVATVSVSLNASSISVGQGTQGTVTLRDSTGAILTGRTIAWSSSNTAVATVNQSGYVTAVGAGTAVISVQSEGKTGSASLTAKTVTSTVFAAKVTLSPSSVTIGSSSQATVVARDSSGALVTGRPVSWTISSGALVATLSGGTASSTSVTGASAGTATVTATVDGVSASATLTVTSPSSTSILLPAQPTLLNFSYPVVKGKSWSVRAGDNLQTVLNSAARGDEIVIEAGATFTGNFTLPAKAGTPATGWILIRSDKSAQLPPQGTRVTPAQASLMPKLVSPNASPALKTAVSGSASGWWISGIEISVENITAINYGLVALGESGAQNSLSLVPSDIVLDRTYVHGLSTSKVSRCIALNSARTAVQDSYVFDCHLKGFDSQAILGWNGPGPFKIVNNTLAGAGENIMFGGADPAIPGLIPSDIEIRRNYIYTPASWKGIWTKKNIFEIKNAQRVLLEGNVLDGSWADGQTGEAVVLKVTNQSGSCTWCTARDMTIRNNVIRNAGSGFAIMGKQGGSPYAIGELLNRLLIEQNIVENVNTGAYTGAARLVSMMNDAQNVTIRNNTMTAPGALSQFLNLSSVPAGTNFAFHNNIVSYGTYGFFSSWYQVGEANMQGFNGTRVFQGVVMIGAAKNGYPNGQFVSSLSAAQATGAGANTSLVNSSTQGVVIP